MALDTGALKILLGLMFGLFSWIFYLATDGLRHMNHRDALGDAALLATGAAMIVLAWILRMIETG